MQLHPKTSISKSFWHEGTKGSHSGPQGEGDRVEANSDACTYTHIRIYTQTHTRHLNETHLFNRFYLLDLTASIYLKIRREGSSQGTCIKVPWTKTTGR